MQGMDRGHMKPESYIQYPASPPLQTPVAIHCEEEVGAATVMVTSARYVNQVDYGAEHYCSKLSCLQPLRSIANECQDRPLPCHCAELLADACPSGLQIPTSSRRTQRTALLAADLPALAPAPAAARASFRLSLSFPRAQHQGRRPGLDRPRLRGGFCSCSTVPRALICIDDWLGVGRHSWVGLLLAGCCRCLDRHRVCEDLQ